MKSLDDQIMEAAAKLDAAHPEQAELLRTHAAYIREAWRGADTYDDLAEALAVIAGNAAEAENIIRDLVI